VRPRGANTDARLLAPLPEKRGFWSKLFGVGQ
jgi:hypothetical protein